MVTALKRIVYRGGIVTFNVPDGWVEKYEPRGGGEFYEDGPDTPTLRLNVITMKGPVATQDDAVRVLQNKAERVDVRADGSAIVRYLKRVDEEGEPLLIIYWEIAQVVPPEHLRLVVFSLTVLESQEEDPEILKTMQLVDAEVSAAQLASVLGT